VTEAPAATVEASTSNLDGIKTYLLDSSTKLKSQTAALAEAGNSYYALAQAANFDYAALWQQQPAEVGKALEDAKAAWVEASPGYERIEGIVAGVPSLAEFDVILDAGTAASEDPEGAVPFDLTLPDGNVLEKPGNLFGITEGTLWGTREDFIAKDVEADLDGDGQIEFGEALPDANVLKAAADAMDMYTGQMLDAANAWQPTESDAFTALVVMIPTMSEYFESWKQSRFISDAATASSDFGVISRLHDIVDILSGLQIVYQNVQPHVASVDEAEATQIASNLDSLRTFVSDVLEQEDGGKRFTAEDADALGGEAQDRASALAGQISQIAAKLDVTIAE
jgi:hypothetical protein